MNGREERLEALYRRYHSALVAHCRGVLRDRAGAEDVAQETFMRAYRYLHALDPERPAWPWLKTIARNVISDRLARESREVSVEDIEVLDTRTSAPAGEDRMVLTQALGALKRRHREALRMRYVEGLEPADAAAKLGLSLAAFNQLLFRSRRNLKVELRRLGQALPAFLADPFERIREWARRLAGRTAKGSSQLFTRISSEAALQVAGSLVALLLVAGVGGRAPANAAAGPDGKARGASVVQTAAISHGEEIDRPRPNISRQPAEIGKAAGSQAVSADDKGGSGAKSVLGVVGGVTGKAPKKSRGSIKIQMPNTPDVVEGVLCDDCGVLPPLPVPEIPVEVPEASK